MQQQTALPLRVLHEPYVERSVAGAWNHGTAEALREGAEFVCITANDVVVQPDCLDRLIAFGADPTNAAVAIWSGIDVSHQAEPGPEPGD